MSKGEIQIYVACLAAYNNGHLHGRWIDAAQEADAIRANITAMLDASPIADAEEWAIHDYDGFEGLSISEYEGVERVVELAAFIGEHGMLGALLVDHLGDLAEARQALDERYCGQFESLADYVQELIEETAIPEQLRFYIDWQAMARDAEISGDVFTIRTGHDEVHVFAGV
ncbi:antirestriction protein ArdA [Citromicrobium sp. WPS32]|uniref:antirestriction protein ArdA n=1 Tax=Citromicrobium sp. WPS32 TaxID=1634517 RepID=UPI0006C916F3|nr:antirestriction protein ArdA [Citromicrobium sp. WPS32]KPM17699.1 antirestriction protein [Citromicrobium sp. WPS32]